MAPLAPFATVSDLTAGWANKELNDSETAAAETLLARATAHITALMRNAGVDVDEDDEVQAENLRAVTVNMVRRSLSSGDGDGLSSMSQTIGSTTASVQWANPSGAFYLSRTDKEVLGIADGGCVGFARPYGYGGL